MGKARRIGWEQSEVRIMTFRNNDCLLLIVILIVLFCCCGSESGHSGSREGCC